MTDLKAVARRAIACLDLTDLSDDADEAALEALCRRASTRHGPVAAVCVWPRFVSAARGHVQGTGIRVATVVNFPAGTDAAEEVIDMTEAAIRDGADEIDLVVPYRELLEGHDDGIPALVRRVREAADGAPVKAILETGVLGEESVIRQAAQLALEGGTDFLKTSTGKVAVNATPVSARILLEEIRAAGRPVGLKPAGGIKSTLDAAGYIALAEEVMGADWVSPTTFRIGASSVLNALLATLDGEDAPAIAGGY
ncbi:MAG: deoxyribose-phosphate aldolase [Pseudomonadota bacterium]